VRKILLAFTLATGLLLGSFLPVGDLLAQAQRTTTGVVWLVPPVNLTAGGGTDTVRAGGLLFTGRTTTDNATVNTWNVVSQAISAATLNTNGQTLVFQVGLLGANNTNTHEYQAYFSNSSATCGGTNAALCDAGCIVLPSITNTTAFAPEELRITITRTGSSTQDYSRFVLGSTTAITAGTCSITDTSAMKLVFGTRNTTAGAASLAQVSYWVWYY
jgi:hypothetical protein